MPELPEAEVVRCQLEARVRGATIHSIWIGRDDIIRQGRETLSWYEGGPHCGNSPVWKKRSTGVPT